MTSSRNRARTPRSEPVSRPPLEGRLAGYRLIRRIATGDRADVYLAVADVDPATGSADGASAPPQPIVAVRIYGPEADEASITTEVEAMSTDATGTLPRLVDVATLADGRCCIIVERIGGPSLSRLLVERTIAPGEAVTILAPIIAAVAELARQGFAHARLAASDIFLDDRGRPRLIGLGELRRMPPSAKAAERVVLHRVAHEALAELVEHVAASVSPANTLDGVIALLRARLDARPFVPCEIEVERALFAAARPEPVGGMSARALAPRLPARVTAPHDFEAGSPADTDPQPSVGAGGRRAGLRQVLALAELPNGISDRLADAADADHVAGLRRRMTGFLRRRGRAAAVGTLLGGGALVLMLTLVPPATAGVERLPGADAAPAATPSGEASQPSAPDTSGPTAVTESIEPTVEVPDDPVVAARRLLEQREVCFATLDITCLQSVVQAGSSIEARDRASIQDARDGSVALEPEFDLTSIEVAAEMGAAVLLRVPRTVAEREPASLLVVRGEAGWRLRELFD
ncbi:hypothetical protein [Agromyces sp. Marseille-P2726]|uniref:hypothetical protein n=1 Tax=Agromyces sp. Marseille-P2726 TaxID=2709132 RepID=UPI00156F457C|nr:hypothetical protein [Agromyces sp. Marseille-P2726]